LTKKSKKRRRRWKTTHKDDKVPVTHQKARHNRPCLRAQDKQEDLNSVIASNIKNIYIQTKGK